MCVMGAAASAVRVARCSPKRLACKTPWLVKGASRDPALQTRATPTKSALLVRMGDKFDFSLKKRERKLRPRLESGKRTESGTVAVWEMRTRGSRRYRRIRHDE